MRMLRYAVPLAAVMLLVSCGGDATAPRDDDSGLSDQIGLAVRVVNAGADNLEIETFSPISIEFCYQAYGCLNPGGGWHSIRYQSVVAQTLPDSAAIGVRVNFVVVEGQGHAEVVRGVAYRHDGFLRFTPGPVVHTSAAFAAGDTIRYTYGTVN
jgi:hypothetical protein